jgi:hypothetical protein
MDVLQGSDWLSDDLIDKAQGLLAQQFPKIDSLQSVCLLEAGAAQSTLGSPERPWIQVILVNLNHWITASNLHGGGNTIQIYDSLFTATASKKTTKQLSVLSFMFAQEDSLHLEFANMQRQTGGSDCGLFALAVATSLAYGQDPTAHTYDQDKMRSHLQESFRLNYMVQFPSKKRRVANRVKTVQDVKLFCICRSPDADRCRMVQCRACKQWYHQDCVSAPDRVFTAAARVQYHCPKC